MEALGRVDHGVVVLEGGERLPEGMIVRVVYEPQAPSAKQVGYRVKFPLVESDNPGSLHLTNEMIADILDQDELSA